MSTLEHQEISTPSVRRIGMIELREALRRGYEDFAELRSDVIFLTIVYPVAMLLIILAFSGAELVPLIFPFVAGGALLGPFLASGLYELSRRREEGRDTRWRHAFDVFKSPSFGSMATLAALLLLLFVAWVAAAAIIYDATLGQTIGYRVEPLSFVELVQRTMTTEAGNELLWMGNLVGFGFALVVLAISAISFPLLLDRDCGPATAMLTSLRLVAKNPLTMAVWGLIVVGLLVLGAIPAFFGLAIVLPVLGHATWHLYRLSVE